MDLCQIINGYVYFRDVIRRGGNAVDAAIAALFCNGLYSPQSMGIGGGFFMTIYVRERKEMVSLIAREMAPSYVDPDMFHGDMSLAQDGRERYFHIAVTCHSPPVK